MLGFIRLICLNDDGLLLRQSIRNSRLVVKFGLTKTSKRKIGQIDGIDTLVYNDLCLFNEPVSFVVLEIVLKVKCLR